MNPTGNLYRKRRCRKRSNRFAGNVHASYTNIWENICALCKCAYRLRRILLSALVAVAAVIIAIFNLVSMPRMVGVGIQLSGEYAFMLWRGFAVIGPLMLTAFCIYLIFKTREILYPWLISVFSLIVPVMLYLTNVIAG